MTEIKTVKCGMVNCYLLCGESGNILVDTATSGCGERITAALGSKKINLIILTHAHGDHVGSAAYLKKALGAPIAMHCEDVELLTNHDARTLVGHTLIGRMLASASRSSPENAAYDIFTPDIMLSDGDELSAFGVDAHIVALPGHTKGSIGVLTGDKEFIAGDAMFNILRPTGARLYEDRSQMEASVKKIRELRPKLIYVGHGKPINPDNRK